MAALGDSLIQGYGLIEEEGFVPQMNAWLAGQGRDVVVLNGGVSGDTSAGGLARIDWTLGPEIDGLIVALGGNDLLRGIDPAVMKENLAGILKRARQGNIPVLLIAQNAPGNFGAAYRAEFDAVYPDLATEFGADLAPSFLSHLIEKAGGLEAVGPYLQADRLHPNREGVSVVVAATGPFVEALVQRITD